MTLLRNQNNTLPLSSTAKVVVTGPSADSMTNQLGGWSVSWQGVFGADHVCCMGPARPDSAGHHCAAGRPNNDPNAVYVADGNTAAARPRTPTSSRSARRPTPRG
jgi:beta-glucosidase